MSATFNLLLLKRQITLLHLSLVMYNFSISSTFSVELPHLIFFLKAYKTSETKGFFPYEWFDSPEKLDATFMPPCFCFFSKLRNCNPVEKEFTDFTKLLNSGFSQQESLKKLRLKNVPTSGIDNYNFPKVVWEQEKMATFRDFVKWYNNKDVVPTLETKQKS